MGHYIQDCMKRIEELQNANKVEGEAAIAYEETTTSNGQVYLTSQPIVKDDWILDSGYTFHMPP